MNMKPDPQEPESRGGAEGSDAAARPDRPAVTDGGIRGKSYTDKPPLTVGKEGAPGKRRSRRLMIAVLAVTMAVSGAIWKQDSLPHWTHPWSTVQAAQQIQTLRLTDADVDHAATDAARAALSRGEIPPSLANTDAATRNKILSGEEKLYTQRLEEENQAQGWIIHVQVSKNGVLVGEDVLTPERPIGNPVPSTPGVPTHFHFTVEKAGPKGFVNPGFHSASGQSVHTGPLATGQSGDVETIVR